MIRQNLVLCGLFLQLLFIKRNVHSLQQIYYKTFQDKEVEGITFDPNKHIYPVIYPSAISCPFIPLQNCRSEKFYWDHFEESCHLSTLCPNGTHAQCVENAGNQFKHVLLVCAPKGNCDIRARNIVYFDNNKPDIYQLGQEKCADGYHHDRHVVCFGECSHDNSIIVLKKSSLTSRAIVYCNYHIGYCNPDKPKLFELTDDANMCLLSYRRYKPCPFGMERISDCTCRKPCRDSEHIRKPYRQFLCRRKDSTILISTSGSKLLTVDVRLQPVTDGLRLSYSYTSERDIYLKVLKIIYSKVGRRKALALPDIVLDNDGSPEHIDIKHLHHGQTYTFTVTLFYEHDGNMENKSLSLSETVQPNPVDNLTSIYNCENITLFWRIPQESKQDHYIVEYRSVRRNRKPAWIHNITRQCNFTIQHVFPGEEYEMRVYSVSNDRSSEENMTSLVVPPLPPIELHVHFPSITDVNVFWFSYDSRSHVENWYLTYNASNEDVFQMNVPYPDDGERVVASLANVQRGKFYTIYVYGVVGDILSILPARSELKIPDLDEERPEISTTVWIILGPCLGLIILICVVFLVALQVCKNVPVIRYIRVAFHIDKLETNINGGSNFNINLNGADLPLNRQTADGDGIPELHER